jgi:hypothetical protein
MPPAMPTVPRFRENLFRSIRVLSGLAPQALSALSNKTGTNLRA